jgi:hypothetical protein
MPIPDRPVDGAEIATEWGQEIHDRTFAPKGTNLRNTTGVTVADNTQVALPITGVIDDPGGWYDSTNHRAEAPADAEGLYICSVVFGTDDLDEASEVRGYVEVNGALAFMTTEAGQGTTAIQMAAVALLVIAAGDQITCAARKIGTAGASITVTLRSLSLIRIGAELGA